MDIGDVFSVEPDAVERKFDELIEKRPEEILIEMDNAKNFIREKINEYEAKNIEIPPELISFEKKLEMFNEERFNEKFAGKPKVIPRKLSETNREALENLSKFLAGITGIRGSLRRSSVISEPSEVKEEEKRKRKNLQNLCQVKVQEKVL